MSKTDMIKLAMSNFIKGDSYDENIKNLINVLNDSKNTVSYQDVMEIFEPLCFAKEDEDSNIDIVSKLFILKKLLYSIEGAFNDHQQNLIAEDILGEGELECWNLFLEDPKAFLPRIMYSVYLSEYSSLSPFQPND